MNFLYSLPILALNENKVAEMVLTANNESFNQIFIVHSICF